MAGTVRGDEDEENKEEAAKPEDEDLSTMKGGNEKGKGNTFDGDCGWCGKYGIKDQSVELSLLSWPPKVKEAKGKKACQRKERALKRMKAVVTTDGRQRGFGILGKAEEKEKHQEVFTAILTETGLRQEDMKLARASLATECLPWKRQTIAMKTSVCWATRKMRRPSCWRSGP